MSAAAAANGQAITCRAATSVAIRMPRPSTSTAQRITIRLVPKI